MRRFFALPSFVVFGAIGFSGPKPFVEMRAASTPSVIHEGLPTQLPDIDPDETQDWIDSLDEVVARVEKRLAMNRGLPHDVKAPAQVS